MNTQEIFKEKYLKYKEKYLKLKELDGGAFDSVKADTMVTNNLNKYTKLKGMVEELNKTLQSVLKKELSARDAAAADREDKDTQMLLQNAKKTTAQTKASLEKAEKAMSAAAENYRKSKKAVSEQKLKYGEATVNATKNNLYKTKNRLASYQKNLVATKEKETLLSQKIEETIKI